MNSQIIVFYLFTSVIRIFYLSGHNPFAPRGLVKRGGTVYIDLRYEITLLHRSCCCPSYQMHVQCDACMQSRDPMLYMHTMSSIKQLLILHEQLLQTVIIHCLTSLFFTSYFKTKGWINGLILCKVI